jgi:glyoxylase-like metal-dependent hydrolase (beta-lactamase superfamily II)
LNAPIAYPHETSPAPGVAVPLAPGVEWLCMPLPFALNHINPGCWPTARATRRSIPASPRTPIKPAWKSALAGRRLTRSIVTHCHPDHLGLAAWLEQETGAGLWIAQGEYLAAHMMTEQIAGYRISAMVEFFRRHGLDQARIDGTGRARQRLQARRAGIPATYRRLFPDQRLRIGDHEWRTIVGHGHAPEHMSLYCAELGVLISGDMLLPRISTNISVMASTP